MMTVEFREQDLIAISRLENRLHNAKASIRRKVLQRVSKKVIAYSKTHTSAQTDLEGQDYPKHHAGRRRKMLVRLARRLKLVSLNGEQAVVGFKSPVESEIGAKQQFGSTEVFRKSDFEHSKQKQQDRDAPATRRQAKALIEAGFRYKTAGKPYRRPTIKWITQNMTIARAGLILRLLRGSKEFWTTVLPPRSFLGATDAEVSEMIQLAIAETEAQLNAALAS